VARDDCTFFGGFFKSQGPTKFYKSRLKDVNFDRSFWQAGQTEILTLH
jgi:hypothetical protein